MMRRSPANDLSDNIAANEWLFCVVLATVSMAGINHVECRQARTLQQGARLGNRNTVVVGCCSSTAQDHVTVWIVQGDKNS